MHALTILIQRPYRKATLLAKGRPQQSTRFKLADQDLDFAQTDTEMQYGVGLLADRLDSRSYCARTRYGRKILRTGPPDFPKKPSPLPRFG
jgi:hypothetical protein